jgi:hypothetical protein
MTDRRTESRMLCADLVTVEWQVPPGALQSATANLEDISPVGACLQMEEPVPPDSVIHVQHKKGVLECRVRYCVFREIGYFIGVEFSLGSEWSPQDFEPEHMLDLRELVLSTIRGNRAKRRAPDSAP